MRPSWIAALVIGVGACGWWSDDPQAGSGAAAPPRDAGLPLGRHWPRQTLEHLIAETSITGTAYAALITHGGGTVETSNCGGNDLHGHCAPARTDVVYVPGVVDDRPLELVTDARGDDALIRRAHVVIDAKVIDPDTVYAKARAALGPPNALAPSLGLVWTRGDQVVTLDRSYLGDSQITFAKYDPASDPKPGANYTDASSDAACKAALVAYDHFIQCTKIDFHDRDVAAIDLVQGLANEPGTVCTRRAAELGELMTKSGCALTP
jgi:hypothetical protein